jgi:transcriptional regulator with XRE-family HTH domain
MKTKINTAPMREQAIALRLAGKSRREIKQALPPMSNATLNEWLRDTPPPDWTRRPNAKDDVHAKARELRAQGLSYNEIAARLGVSKSSVSLWIRDMPRPPHLSPEESKKRAADGARRYWAARREVSETRRAAEVLGAATEVSDLTKRELLIAGAIAYWCEGSKNKGDRILDRVAFINSDPALITFFLRFLDAAGVAKDDLILRVYIHENADPAAAQRFWVQLTGVQPSQFRPPTLKHHNPKTHRTNVGENYHGCLRIDVRRSRSLYRKIEGWATGVTNTQILGTA